MPVEDNDRMDEAPTPEDSDFRAPDLRALMTGQETSYDEPLVQPDAGYYQLMAYLKHEQATRQRTDAPALTEAQKARIHPRKYGLRYKDMIRSMILEEDLSGYYVGNDPKFRLPPRTGAIRCLNMCLRGITSDDTLDQPGRMPAYREIERAQWLLECSRPIDGANDPSRDPWLMGCPVDDGEFYAHFGQSREGLNQSLGLPPGTPLQPHYRPPGNIESINKVLDRLEKSRNLANHSAADAWHETPGRYFRWGMNRCIFIMHSLYNREIDGFRWNDWSNYETDRPYYAVTMDGDWIRMI